MAVTSLCGSALGQLWPDLNVSAEVWVLLCVHGVKEWMGTWCNMLVRPREYSYWIKVCPKSAFNPNSFKLMTSHYYSSNDLSHFRHYISASELRTYYWSKFKHGLLEQAPALSLSCFLCTMRKQDLPSCQKCARNAFLVNNLHIYQTNYYFIIGFSIWVAEL